MWQPVIYEFNRFEAHLMGQTFYKKFEIGKILREGRYLDVAQNMLAQELITLTPLEKQEKGRKFGFKMHITDKGKEAWVNFGRKAANLQPIVMEKKL